MKLSAAALVMALVLSACNDPVAPHPCDLEPGCEFEGAHLTVSLDVRGAEEAELLVPGPVTMDVEIVNRGSEASEPLVLFVGASQSAAETGLEYQQNLPALQPREVYRATIVDTLLASGVQNGLDDTPLEAVLHTGGEFPFIVATADAPVGLALPIPELNAIVNADTITFGHPAIVTISVRNTSPTLTMAPQRVSLHLVELDVVFEPWGVVEIPAIGPGQAFENAFLVTVSPNAGYTDVDSGIWEYHVAACIAGSELYLCRRFGTDKHVFGVPDLDTCAGADAVIDATVPSPIRCGRDAVWRFEAVGGTHYRFTTTPPGGVAIAQRDATGVASGEEWVAPATGRYYITKSAFDQPGDLTLRVEVVPTTP